MRPRTFITFVRNLLLSLPLLALYACGEDVSGIEGAIVDNSNNANKLQQLLLIVKVTDPSSRHVVLGKIDSVKLKVNGQKWGTFPSDSLNAEGIETTVAGNFNVTDDDVGYLVIARYTLALDTLQTAGQYANYLNERLRLPPGDYVCEIAEIHFRDLANNPVTIKPHIYRSFAVEENIASLFLGEINVSVN